MKNYFTTVICFVGCIFCSAQSTLIVQSGTELKLSTGNYLVLENTHFTNNGALNLSSGNGTFKFSGSSNTNISGANQPLFNNIQLAKTGAAQLLLQRNIDVRGTVTFTSGIFHLNNYVIDLGSVGSLSTETESSHVIAPAGGYIQWTGTLNAPSAVNPGNLGLTLTTGQNLGSTVIRRGHQSQMNGSGGGSSILRYFDISPTNNSGLNATLQINYLDAEINGLSESSFGLWKSASLPTWSYIGYDGRDSTANYVYKTGIASFSRWTISTINNPLPVVFSLFNTRCDGNSVLVKWITETEINTSRFEVQRSMDGVGWTTITVINAAGNSTAAHQYSYTDNSSLQNGYYRVVSIDVDGRKTYTSFSRVRCDKNFEFKLWPNPARDQVWISLSVAADKNSRLKVIDSKGSVVYLASWQLYSGNNILSIPTQTWQPGSYIVQFISDEEIKSLKLIKQ